MNRAIFILAIALAGCEPGLYALSAPPIGAVAELDSRDKHIEISRGVALAFECVREGPCENATVTVADDAIASVQPARVDDLSPYGRRGPQPRSVFVIGGIEPGETFVSVLSDSGDVTYSVTVLAPE